MEDLLISTLGALGYPVYLQGSLMESEPYPDSFFTFWNDSADAATFYDNKEKAIEWLFTVNFYSVNPLLVNSVLLTAKPLLKEAGFTVTGAGHSVGSDEATHTGRGIDVLYYKNS